MTKALLVLGSTGSIGVSTLAVVRQHPERFRVEALTANKNAALMYEQCLEFQPTCVAMADMHSAQELVSLLEGSNLNTKVMGGAEAITELAAFQQADITVAAIVGAAGLSPSLAAIKAGKRVLLANKEALVCGGRLFMDAVDASGATLLPVDSEHNAIFQCLDGRGDAGVRRILLTASGGPFLRASLQEMESATPAQACAHPNWNMGAKISVDSATMMNKGLELIEACWLFHCNSERVDIVVHPQSIVHSMVEFLDGSVLAQMSHPDMRIPISYGLAWPDQIESGAQSLDFRSLGNLQFEEPDLLRFPCLGLAVDIAREGGSYPLFMNAANEVAVEAFLQRKIGFGDIYRVINNVTENGTSREPASIEEVIELDAAARRSANDCLEAMR